jgi:hypothetical protein
VTFGESGHALGEHLGEALVIYADGEIVGVPRVGRAQADIVCGVNDRHNRAVQGG